MQQALRVIKLGGSLLDWPALREQFELWLAKQAPVHSIMIVGGGNLVGVFRRLCQRVPVDETVAHWICIDLMSITARLASEILGLPLTANYENLTVGDQGILVFDAAAWLRTRQIGPCSWDVTSDSIAAFVATALRADELVLLKSTLPAAANVLLEPGFVDNYFSTAIRNYRTAKSDRGALVRFVNLRDTEFGEGKLA